MQSPGAYSSGVQAKLDGGNRINPAVVLLLAVLFALLILFVTGQSAKLFDTVMGTIEETEKLGEELKKR